MKLKTFITFTIAISLFIVGCGNGDTASDAYGNFEVDEITISAKSVGELLTFNVVEGQELNTGDTVGQIDTTDLHLQRADLDASRLSLAAQRKSVEAQIKVNKREVQKLLRDQQRIQSMYNDQAATQKQLDDITSAVDIANESLLVLETQYPAIVAQAEAINAKMLQLEQRIADATIVNPLNGTVLVKFAQNHERVAPGKPLYSLADLNNIYLRAYVVGKQLSEITLGQNANVVIDSPNGELTEHPGTVSWISSKAEFTPKNVQTREERVSQVYAIKIRVENNGEIKVGMPGEVRWSAQ